MGTCIRRPAPDVVVLHEGGRVVEEDVEGAACEAALEGAPAEPAAVPLRQLSTHLQHA